MEKKDDVRVKIIEQIIVSKMNIVKLEDSLKEPSTEEEKILINSIIKAEQLKIEKLENEKNAICAELQKKREKYENQNQIMNKSFEELEIEKNHFKELILKDEENGHKKSLEDGKYKDAIQEHRTLKIKELDNKMDTLKMNIVKNDKFINEINKVLFLLGYEHENKVEDEKIEKKDKNENERKITNVETEKEKYFRIGQETMKDISTDYKHTHLKAGKIDRDIKVNIEEENDIDKREKEKIYKQGTVLPEEQILGLYENEEIPDEYNKKENVFKRIYKKIKSFKLIKRISVMFKKVKNRTKLLIAKKENSKEETIKNEINSIEKKAVCEKVNVNNLIDVMNNAVEKKYGKNKNEKEDENEITL